MKLPALLSILALGCLAALGLRAAEPAASPADPAPLTPAQIDELLAPIALYPDPLVAIILPAATFPTDIVMAARYLDAERDADAIDNQPWDDSVKSLARYPDVVKWMDENLEWTQQLGAAFTLQPAAMLTGTQRLRAAAIAAGNLKTTPEQTVIVEKEVVRIVPAQREVIYVPVYDPYWVYRPWTSHSYYHPRPVITFSSGYHTGFWLSYHFNWGSSAIVIVNRPYRAVVWHNYPAWHYPSHTVVHHHHVWRPAPVVVHKVRRDYHRRPVVNVVQPTVNVHVQRNVTRNVNRDVTINRERNVSRERDVVVNRERTVNRPTSVNTSAPRREVTTRTSEDFRSQNRPETVNRPVVTRPATNAPAPTNRDLASARPERLERPTRSEQTTRVVNTAPAQRPVVTTPRPAPTRPAPQISRDSDRTREPRQLAAPITRQAPTAQTPAAPAPRMRPAPSPEVTRTPRPAPVAPAPTVAPAAAPTISVPTARTARTERPNVQQRTRTLPPQPLTGADDSADRRGFNRMR